MIMTDTTPSRPTQGESANSSNVVADPPSRLVRNILGIYFCVVAALTFYLLVATWPVLAPGDGAGFVDFSLFGWGGLSAPSDLRLFFTVIAAGALGSLIHTLTSFADFAGNRTLSRNWIWWFILRTPIGIALALLFYFVLRGGLMVPSLPGRAADATQLVNPYGIAGISALAGMFSKQATDKLREIFDTLFRTSDPVKRTDPLTRAIPTITGTQPPKLTVNAPLAVDILGRGFLRDCTAAINGEERKVQWMNESLLKLTLESKDVAAAGQLKLAVCNPGPAGGSSEPFTIQVEA
jgi:hypothetical protein